MPYITKSRRVALRKHSLTQLPNVINGPGDLNFIISTLANGMVQNLPKKTYADLSAIRGAISDAAEEFYRRVMAPYEDQKIIENGDVYEDEP